MLCNDKTHENTIEDKILSGELNREDCEENNEYKFLCLLKRRLITQVKIMKELIEE